MGSAEPAGSLAVANAALAAHGGGAGGGAGKAGGAGGVVDEGAIYAQIIAVVDAARSIPDGAAPLPTL
ncbi:uncharacterized protein DFL_005416 [Arthrobotrys flagrans]|uniref:Uncharacterized protein n=1 Tax=Arthrobotrys flagrans TaxID=97331 RepID=A0A436ZY15_ARTFL|nr:hypothetical protein DFL_005416 [Arthrobotrys flagrans]